MNFNRDFVRVFAVISAFLSIVFLVFGTRMYFYTAMIVDSNQAQQFLWTQLLISLAVSLCLASTLYAVFSLAIKRLQAQKSALNDRYTREIDFHQTAINLHTVLCVSDSGGVIIEANENFEATFGYSQDEIIGEHHSVLFGEGKQDPQHRDIEAALEEDRVWTGEQKMVSKSGEPIFVNATVIPQFNTKGRHTRTVFMLTDVTVRRTADTERFLSTMLEELQDEIYVFDVDTLAIRYLNRSARRRCEWSIEEARCKRISDTAPNFDTGLFRKHTQPLFDGSKKLVTIEAMHPKGPVEITTRVITGMDGKRHFLSVLRDLSHRKVIESAKMESIATVSHELRSPLTSIKGSLRLLQSGAVGDLPEKAAPIVDIAARNSDQLLLLVNDILDLEKIGSGQMEFARDKVDLIALIDDAIGMNLAYADKYKVKLSRHMPEESATITGDYDRLIQVMTNLMSNAIKFSPQNEAVDITLERRTETWRVRVTDRGAGIPEKVRSLIGQPFSQHSSADGKKREGTGLGLVIVKKILVHHQSRLRFTSEVGVGTEFYFDLPAEDARPKEPPKVDNIADAPSSQPSAEITDIASLASRKAHGT